MHFMQYDLLSFRKETGVYVELCKQLSIKNTLKNRNKLHWYCKEYVGDICQKSIDHPSFFDNISDIWEGPNIFAKLEQEVKTNIPNEILTSSTYTELHLLRTDSP